MLLSPGIGSERADCKRVDALLSPGIGGERAPRGSRDGGTTAKSTRTIGKPQPEEEALCAPPSLRLSGSSALVEDTAVMSVGARRPAWCGGERQGPLKQSVSRGLER
jgi:hypothetical protein